VIIPYSIAAYKRADLPRIRLTNLYAEKTPASREQVALMPRPALEEYQEVGEGPIRGMYGQPGALDGALFTVSGEELYAGDQLVGDLPGTARVSMAASASELLIANDTGLYLSDGETIEAVEFPDDAGVTSVAFINGYFLAARADSQRFYWSGILDGSTWDPLDYASAERAPDNIVAIWIVSDDVWIFGEVTTEVWISTGDGEVPFQRVEGRLYDQGCLSRDTIAKMDNSIFWVGHDFKVYRGDSQPLRVSDHGVEEAIQLSDVSDLRAWSFPWMGSVFYVLATSSGTYAYNAATGLWSNLASYEREVWRAHLGVFLAGEVIAGDDEEGKLWRLSNSLLLDGDAPIERRFTVLEPNALFLDNLLVDASTGEAQVDDSGNIAEVRLSRDYGNTFGTWMPASLGAQGQYRARLVWRRLGMIDGDGAVLDFRMSDPQLFRVSSVRMNEPLGGRGR
jgi:hypothetical protein